MKRTLFGEFLVNAQGEDVVAGIRTPQPIAEMAEAFPEVYARVYARIAELLEQPLQRHAGHGVHCRKRTTCYMLQTRNGKRTAPAAVKIAVDMEAEGLIRQGNCSYAYRTGSDRPAACTLCSTQHELAAGREADKGTSCFTGSSYRKDLLQCMQMQKLQLPTEKRLSW